MGRLLGEGDDGEDAGRRAADVREDRVPPRGDGGRGARRGTPGEAGHQRPAAACAQVLPQESFSLQPWLELIKLKLAHTHLGTYIYTYLYIYYYHVYGHHGEMSHSTVFP